MIILEVAIVFGLALLIAWNARRRRVWSDFIKRVNAITEEPAAMRAIAALYPEGARRQFAAKMYALFKMGKDPAWVAIHAFGESIEAAARRIPDDPGTEG